LKKNTTNSIKTPDAGMSDLLMHISSMAPFRLLRNLARVNPLIINYHVVADEELPHISELYAFRSVSRFIADMDFLGRHFHPIGLESFLDHIHNNNPLPDNSLLLTFDDGLRQIYDVVAPVLESKNLTATFFLTSDFIDNQVLGYDHKKSLLIRHLTQPGNQHLIHKISTLPGLHQNRIPDLRRAIMGITYPDRFLVDNIASELNYNFDDFLHKNNPYVTTEQVRDMIARGFTFGSHSLDHPRFSELTLEEQVDQAISSTNYITGRFSLPYKVFAFPYSDRNVSLDFFARISSEIEASFGTHGLLSDQAGNNYQRISVERFKNPPGEVIKFHFIRKIIYSSIGRDTILRQAATQAQFSKNHNES
jgi:peptidoglycan/xylan/chitin deacetylase (PgdA/CDA1 family)